jgi:hypothetical protein
MSEVLVLSLVSRIHPSLNLGIPNMSFLQHRPNSTAKCSVCTRLNSGSHKARNK